MGVLRLGPRGVNIELHVVTALVVIISCVCRTHAALAGNFSSLSTWLIVADPSLAPPLSLPPNHDACRDSHHILAQQSAGRAPVAMHAYIFNPHACHK